MQAHITPPPAAFFNVLPTAAGHARKTLAANSCPLVATVLTTKQLRDRLGLLAQLELPCTILITSPHLHLRETRLHSAEMTGDSLNIIGKDFTLCLRSANIHSIHLSSHHAAVRGMSSLDIWQAPDRLYASIQPVAGDSVCGVWQDVMDNPMLV